VKVFADLFDIVPGWIWAVVCAACVTWGGANQYRVQAARSDLAQLQAAQAEAIVAAQAAAAEQTLSLQRTKDEAIAEAENRAAANAVAAGRARTELDRLRKQATTGAGDASATHAACTQYAAAATDVLNECGSALQSLAATADGHVNDIRTLTGAWPEWDKFTQQMTEFSNRIKEF
jgi:hypothetical protein